MSARFSLTNNTTHGFYSHTDDPARATRSCLSLDGRGWDSVTERWYGWVNGVWVPFPVS